MILPGVSGSGGICLDPASGQASPLAGEFITTNTNDREYVPSIEPDEWTDEPPTRAGYMERAVLADIATFGADATVGRSAYVAIAISLARVLDRESEEVGVTAMAKAADSLRVIMDVLGRPRGEKSNDVLERLLSRLGEPIDDAQTPKAPV